MQMPEGQGRAPIIPVLGRRRHLFYLSFDANLDIPGIRESQPSNCFYQMTPCTTVRHFTGC